MVAVAAGLLVPEAAGLESYHLIEEWGSFGIGEPGKFSHPQFLAVDEDGTVYVSDLGNKRIQEFSRFGHFESDWGSSGKAEGGFHYPAGIAAYNGSVFVSDRDLNRIQKFTSNGTFVSEWGSRGGGEGKMLLPNDIAIHNGTIYVTDTGNHRVQAFTVSGEFVLTMGSSGLGEGQFLTPLGIDTDKFGNVYVTDRGNSKIVKFYPNGTVADEFYFNYYGYVFAPSAITIDPDGAMYVFNSATGRIMHLAQDAPELVGIREQQGPYKTTFENSVDLAIGMHGELLVADSAGHTVRSFETPFYVQPVITPPENLTEEEVEIFYDTTRPEIAPPADMTIQAEDYMTRVEIGSANATDESGIRAIASNAPSSYRPGDTIVVWTAFDNAGYSAAAEQRITVTVCGKHVSQYNVIRGTDAGDVLQGTDADDLIFGLEGNDLITGGGGDDCIFGGHDDDIISGGEGDDTIRGNSGHDILKGEEGSDGIYPGEGYDVIDGGEGHDWCHPVADRDVAIGCE